MTAQEVLKSIGTCEPARKWVGCKSIKTAWAKCERGDWLAWVCGKMLDRRELVGLLGELVSGTPRRDGRTVRDLLTDPRSIAALDACAAYARGDLTAAELHATATAYAATAATADAFAAAAAATPCAETWQSDFIRARVSWARVEAKIKELEAAE